MHSKAGKLHVETVRSRNHTGCQLEAGEGASLQGKGRANSKRLTLECRGTAVHGTLRGKAVLCPGFFHLHGFLEMISGIKSCNGMRTETKRKD